MSVLVAIYADLELYPPSLNAVYELAARVDHVHVVQRSLGHACAELPENVTVTSAVLREGATELGRMTARDKLQDFVHYVRCLRKVRYEMRPQIVLAYDPLPLMAVRLSGLGKRSSLLWYHNHDKEIRNTNRLFSLGWWAYTTEASAFQRIDFFTVPARERLVLFPITRLSAAPVILPNYPSRRQIGQSHLAHPGDKLRLVYQGSLGRHHGFEEIIPWLDRRVDGRSLHLTLVGKIDATFQRELLALAKACGVAERFVVKDFVPFTELPAVLSTFDIGLAIHKPVGVTYSTGGTASNKIYEYAAAGLPVVLYDSAHYREHLADRPWVAFCHLNWEMFSAALESLLDGLDQRSCSAMADIQESLNYETVFHYAWGRLISLLEKAESHTS